MKELQASGEIREDVPPEEIGCFLGLVLDGLVVRASFGLGSDVEPVLRLINDALAPRT
jgi:hypothetical protein